jgi:hypothetical protein
MAGYKPTKKLYDLEFVDFPGLEVKARSASIGEIKAAQELNIDPAEKDPEKQMEAFTFFEKKIVEWNIIHPEIDDGDICPVCGLKEDDPVPPTVAGMLCLDISMMLAIIFGWIQTVARVSVPKGMSTNGGAMSIPEDTMQKLAMLQNPGGLPTPNLSLD